MIHSGRDGIELLILRLMLGRTQHICKTLLICFDWNFTIIYILDRLPRTSTVEAAQFQQIVTGVKLGRSSILLKRRQVFICELHLIIYVFPEALLLLLQVFGARNDLIDVHVRVRIISFWLRFGVIAHRLRWLPEYDLVFLGGTIHRTWICTQSYFARHAFIDVALWVLACICWRRALSWVQVEVPISERSLRTIWANSMKIWTEGLPSEMLVHNWNVYIFPLSLTFHSLLPIHDQFPLQFLLFRL